ncbi:homeobox protein engrailed-1-like [Trichoplusia ni]|uniref:Homeobox protein engrailed-1-like n=1 Tax=Trichoplusia ni TaxID=7111 RepID=A0A7E5WWV3_TRINI|nr:homeobox protein engrailed-1-like [Trichoplusia ni]
MLVSPEATEQPQADLGSTINALVSATPPNVTLTRTDYQHQIYHQNSQMGPHYGTNKITTSQQNPMLSRQLSVAGSGGYSRGGGAGGHSAAALHTPMTPAPPPSTPQPYHRPPHQPHAPHAPHAPHQPHAPHAPHAPLAPRPHLVGGYYEEGGAGAAGYCGDYARCTPLAPHVPHAQHAPHASHAPHAPHPPLDHQHACAGSGAGAAGTSEYVRNELRAVVGARSARPDLHPLQPPDMDSLMSFDMTPPGGGSVVGGRASSASTNSWESQQSTPSTTEAGSAEAAAGGDEARAAAGAGQEAKASLLQKLLSQ